MERTLNPSMRMNDPIPNRQSTTNVISTPTPKFPSRKQVEELSEENEKRFVYSNSISSGDRNIVNICSNYFHFSSSLHFSRSCPICLISSPIRRVVFIPCGHSIQNARSSLIICPLCRAKSEVVSLFEDIFECKNELPKCLGNDETSAKCPIFPEKVATNDQTKSVRSPKSKFRSQIISRFPKLFP